MGNDPYASPPKPPSSPGLDQEFRMLREDYLQPMYDNNAQYYKEQDAREAASQGLDKMSGMGGFIPEGLRGAGERIAGGIGSAIDNMEPYHGPVQEVMPDPEIREGDIMGMDPYVDPVPDEILEAVNQSAFSNPGGQMFQGYKDIFSTNKMNRDQWKKR